MNEKREEIKEKLREIFSAVLGREITEDSFKEGPGLTGRLHIDSLMGLQIIVKIEQKFGVIIEDDDFAIQMLDAIDKAIDFIESSISPDITVP
ncbi:MAG TPA: phosphopantetheine-binding protein [Pseudobacteroides sp.]|uniref:acyl carrier protein n=1 Tax=Pseudobacteroides sp. TaxID=1968840 RepID=UPI002F950FAB